MGKEVKEEQNRLKGCVVSSITGETTVWLLTGRAQRHQPLHVLQHLWLQKVTHFVLWFRKWLIY